MIIYSIIDPDFVFEGWDDFEPEYKEMEVSESVSMLVEDVNEDELRVIKLISSDPQDYLNTDYSPGSLIKKKASF
jgi:hypothetical protein